MTMANGAAPLRDRPEPDGPNRGEPQPPGPDRTRRIRRVTRDGIVHVTFHRPPLNIFDFRMLEELLDALDEVHQDPPRALILSGAHHAFSAGLDVREYPERMSDLVEALHSVFRRLITFDGPILAGVHGPCVGAGLEIAGVCDFVIASDGATFGQPEIGLGLVPPVATIILPRLIGPLAANELILTGRIIDAAEAQRLGLVSRVVPSGDGSALGSALDELAETLVSHSGPVTRCAKRAMYARFRTRFMEELAELEAMVRDELTGLEDTREGLNAFLEKREPKWKHR